MEEDVARQDLVRRALDHLSLDQRACLLLYAWTGYTCAEIGEIMGRTPEAVRMLLVRARRRFRELYDDLDRDDGSLGSDETPSRPHSDRPTPATLCAARDETLPLYARGDLPRETFNGTSKHLEECADCRVALQNEHALNRLLQRSIVLSFASPPAAWHALPVLVKRRAQTQQGELDGSTQVVGIQVRRQVGQVGAQVERQVREDLRQSGWQVG